MLHSPTHIHPRNQDQTQTQTQTLTPLECLACFESGTPQDELMAPATQLPHRGYMMCSQCARLWYSRNTRCPVCNLEPIHLPQHHDDIILDLTTMRPYSATRIILDYNHQPFLDRRPDPCLTTDCRNTLCVIAYIALALSLAAMFVRALGG